MIRRDVENAGPISQGEAWRMPHPSVWASPRGNTRPEKGDLAAVYDATRGRRRERPRTIFSGAESTTIVSARLFVGDSEVLVMCIRGARR